MSKKLFYTSICMALVAFSSYAHEEPVQEDDQLKKEQVFVQAEETQDEETVIQHQDDQLACECKKRKKGKKAASLRFVNMTSEQNEESTTEETLKDEALAWSSFNIFIHTATF